MDGVGGVLQVGTVGHGRSEHGEASTNTEDQEPAEPFGEGRRPTCLWRGRQGFFFFITLGLELGDTKVYEP